tara:strand:- start:2349 stop:3728 length:1380 start_codon:yes stop_codon:yes gene_type:complete
MDSTSNTYKEKDDMQKKIINTMIPISIIIVILFTFVYVVYRTNQAKQLLINTLYVMFGIQDNKVINWIISIIAISSFIGFFYALAFFPKDLQELIFNNVVFEKTNIDLGFNLKSVNLTNDDVISKLGKGFYYISIIAIFVYFNYNHSDSNTYFTRMTFIAGLLMSYIFISIIIISFNSVDTGLKFSSGQLTAILVSIGFVAAIISSFNYNDVSKFWPGPELHLIYRILLFIPCLYTYLINFIKDEMNSTTPTSLIILIINVLIISAYIISNNNTIFTPKTLLNKPIYLNRETILTTYENLTTNVSNKKYKLSLSFWSNINVVRIRDKSINIIDVTDKFNVKYNEKYDELSISVHTYENSNNNKETKEIIYLAKDNMPLQKWNNFVINYNSGTLDIFMNNKLILSQPNIILNTKPLSVITGEHNGLTGGICNVRMFNRELKIEEIERIYNKSKNKTPPIV